MRSRFYVPDLPGLDLPVELSAEEASHLTRVLRLGVGDTVSVFDGRGAEYLAQVVRVAQARVVVRPYRAVVPTPEPVVALTVAQSLLKGRKFDEVIRDVPMIGVAAVQPLLTARTEVRSCNTERWRRVAIASAKQCRRAIVPDIMAPRSFNTLLNEDDERMRLILVEPEMGDTVGTLRDLQDRPLPRAATLAIGPEGGWTAEEVAAATGAGFVPITFGHRTLRAEAVVVCAVSVLQYIWGDL